MRSTILLLLAILSNILSAQIIFTGTSHNELKKEKYLGIFDKSKPLLITCARIINKENKDFLDKILVVENTKERYVNRIYLAIMEEEDYNGAYCYSFFYSDKPVDRNKLPTLLFNDDSIYIVFYLKNSKSMPRKNIPMELLIEYDEELHNEQSYKVLICKESMKATIFEDSNMPFQAIVELRDFSCNNRDKDTTVIKIEKSTFDKDAYRKWENSFK